MKQKRARVKVKTSIAGSSDFRRIKAARAILTENHVKNVTFFAAIKEGEEKEEPIITESLIISRYSRVFALGHWCPVHKFIGSLVFMYNDNYHFE